MWQDRVAVKAAGIVLCVVALSSCSGVREWAETNTKNDVTDHIERVRSRITLNEINGCMAKRWDLPEKANITGAPTFEPNLFYTCLALKSPQVGSLFTGEGDYIAFEVHLPVKPNPAAIAPGRKIVASYFKFNCLFKVKSDGVQIFEQKPQDEVFGAQVVASRIHRNHLCMAVPGAKEQVRPAW